MSRDKETKQAVATFSYEQFENFIITALEGGSNYWYFIKDTDIPPIYVGCPSRVERIAQKLWDDPEYKLPIYDMESGMDEDGMPDESELEKLGDLSMENFQKYAAQSGQAFGQFMSNDMDAGDADNLLQMTVMQELTFG